MRRNYKETVKMMTEAARRRNRKLNQYNGFIGKLIAQKRVTKEEVKEFFDKGKELQTEKTEPIMTVTSPLGSENY